MTRACFLPPLLALLGCQEPTRAQAPAPPRPDARPLMIAIQDGRGLVFSYFDTRADLRAVERVEQVPEEARAEVMVTDPARLLPSDNIYVADLRKRAASGEYRVWIEPRRSWLDRRMPKTSQLRALARLDPPAEKAAPEAKQKPKKKVRPKRKLGAKSAGAEPAAAAPQARPKVALFSTAWCPSCRAARAHLQARKVAFVELDVEKDAEAAQQYQAAQQAFRLRPGVVPLILVAGKPLQGFSAAQLDAALAAAGLLPR